MASGSRVALYAAPDPSVKGRLLEPFVLIRRFNSESAFSVHHLSFSDDSRFLIYSSDDFVLRMAPSLGGDFPRAKLRGHKAKILGTVSYLAINQRLLSIDSAGLVLLWELVDRDPESLPGFKSLTGSKIKQDSTTSVTSTPALRVPLSPLELAYKKGRFILKTKLLLFQEKTHIDHVSFSTNKEHCTVAFKNHSFGVYRINSFEPDELIQNLVTFRKDPSFGSVSSLTMHPSKPLIGFGDSKKSLVVWDWRAKSYVLKQRALTGAATAVGFSTENKFVAVGDALGVLKVFDFRSLLNTVSFQNAQGKITGVK